MSVWDIVVLVLIGGLVLSRFLIFKLPKDTRDKATRKGAYKNDFQNLFNGARKADPKAGFGRDGERQKSAAPKDVTPARKPVEAPVVKKMRLKELEAMGGMEQVKAMDPAFSEKKFLEGAKRAHAYFYKCWNERDLEGLAELCSPVLVNRIAAEWEDGWQKLQVSDVKEAHIGNARVSGRTAIVEAELVAQHKQGRKAAEDVTSRWLLARAIGSSEPDWELQDMKVEMDA